MVEQTALFCCSACSGRSRRHPRRQNACGILHGAALPILPAHYRAFMHVSTEVSFNLPMENIGTIAAQLGTQKQRSERDLMREHRRSDAVANRGRRTALRQSRCRDCRMRGALELGVISCLPNVTSHAPRMNQRRSLQGIPSAYQRIDRAAPAQNICCAPYQTFEDLLEAIRSR
jgi:hypothetical protein